VTDTMPALPFSWSDVSAAVADFLGESVVATGLVLVIAISLAPLIVSSIKRVFRRR